MNSIDLFVIIVTAFFLVRGLFRGFILELTIVIGLFSGYILAASYHDLLSAILIGYFTQLPESAADIISFAAIFILVNIVLRIVAGIITKTLKFAMLGWLNRLLGAIFGSIKSLIILSIAVFILNLIPFSDSLLQKIGKEDSFFFPLLEMVGPELYKQVEKTDAKKFLEK